MSVKIKSCASLEEEASMPNPAVGKLRQGSRVQGHSKPGLPKTISKQKDK